MPKLGIMSGIAVVMFTASFAVMVKGGLVAPGSTGKAAFVVAGLLLLFGTFVFWSTYALLINPNTAPCSNTAASPLIPSKP